MGISKYKGTRDIVEVGLWDWGDTAYAEPTDGDGGDAGGTNWGMNDNWRNIIDAINDLDEAIEELEGQITENIPDHNDTTSIQGGESGQYYHLNFEEYQNAQKLQFDKYFEITSPTTVCEEDTLETDLIDEDISIPKTDDYIVDIFFTAYRDEDEESMFCKLLVDNDEKFELLLDTKGIHIHGCRRIKLNLLQGTNNFIVRFGTKKESTLSGIGSVHNASLRITKYNE